jgi:hypothetical protein
MDDEDGDEDEFEEDAWVMNYGHASADRSQLLG